MKTFSKNHANLLIMSIMVQTMALTLSCSSGGDAPPPEPSYGFCITAENVCLTGPFTASLCNGQLSNNCPSVASSSSSSNSLAPPAVQPSSNSAPPPGGGENNNIANYKTVKIGDQTWMAENLNYAVEDSKCYDNQDSNCDTYGRLYKWTTAMNLPENCETTSCASQINAKHRGICPAGWHIPSNAEWAALFDAVSDSSTAGKYLKATSGWNEGGNGEDTYDFAARPGGYGSFNGNFYNIGNFSRWWSSSEFGGQYAYNRGMNYDSDKAGWYDSNKDVMLSVRCVQDDGVIPSIGSSSSRLMLSSSLSSSSRLISSSSLMSSSSFMSSSSESTACVNPSSYGSFNSVTIGEQTWMAENLNYAACGSACYGDDPANCAKYGRLYNWITAMDFTEDCKLTSCATQINVKHRGICPEGWHVPSNAEWEQLFRYVDGNSGTNIGGVYESPTAGKQLKAASGWNEGVNGEDTHDFAALPGGFRYSDGLSNDVGNSGYWWSSNEHLENKNFSAYVLSMNYNSRFIAWGNFGKSFLFSVRCVQD
jgi:uncharacterized protein (TIGR02145 family)